MGKSGIFNGGLLGSDDTLLNIYAFGEHQKVFPIY